MQKMPFRNRLSGIDLSSPTDSFEINRRTDLTLLGGFGVAIAGVAFGLAGGFSGLTMAIGLVVSWLLFSPVYSYAVGHLLTLGVSAEVIGTVELLVIEIGLIAVLLGPLTLTKTSNRAVTTKAIIGVGMVSFGLIVAGLALADQLWITALVLLAGMTLLGYTIHRYELVELDLISNDETSGGSS